MWVGLVEGMGEGFLLLLTRGGGRECTLSPADGFHTPAEPGKGWPAAAGAAGAAPQTLPARCWGAPGRLP